MRLSDGSLRRWYIKDLNNYNQDFLIEIILDIYPRLTREQIIGIKTEGKNGN